MFAEDFLKQKYWMLKSNDNREARLTQNASELVMEAGGEQEEQATFNIYGIKLNVKSENTYGFGGYKINNKTYSLFYTFDGQEFRNTKIYDVSPVRFGFEIEWVGEFSYSVTFNDQNQMILLMMTLPNNEIDEVMLIKSLQVDTLSQVRSNVRSDEIYFTGWKTDSQTGERTNPTV